jgi:hypothetical protein
MKKSIVLAASLLALNLTPIWGQQPATPTPPLLPPSSPRLYAPPSTSISPSDAQQLIEQQSQRLLGLANPPAKQTPALTKFNLDFPGGTPKELVAAIEKATHKPLNVIISDKDADVRLPPLKLNNVNVWDLFNALQSASTKVESYSAASVYMGFPPSYQQMATSYGFKTDGTVTDDSIWYFVVTKPTVTPEVPPQKICRFYPLAEYLNRGFTVDDITTAIQTGWKMSGDPAKPELNYHNETKLLIAFGEPGKLNVIDEVLKALQPPPEDSGQILRRLLEKRQQETPTLAAPISPPSTNSPAEKSGK